MPVAVVVGGSGGIGTAICEALARDRFRVVVGYRNSEAAAKELVARLPGDGHFAISMPVTDSEKLEEAATRISDEAGQVDVLVNCAGTTRFVPHGDLDSLDDELFDEIFTTNVRGAFAAVRAFRPLLDQSSLDGGGVIVNISSWAAVSAMGSNIAYCASKAALDTITRSLARALAPSIRVVSVSPGVVDTDFIKSLDPAWRDEQVARSPLGRLATPEEVAATVTAAIRTLVFMTGAVIPVDGGRLLG